MTRSERQVLKLGDGKPTHKMARLEHLENYLASANIPKDVFAGISDFDKNRTGRWIERLRRQKSYDFGSSGWRRTRPKMCENLGVD